jgi:hypothetical protein
LHLTDDLKARVLSTFLTLMNLRENLDRASMRTPTGRGGVWRLLPPQSRRKTERRPQFFLFHVALGSIPARWSPLA